MEPSVSTIRYSMPSVIGRIGSGHAVIQASAGTGKTYTLEHLVVDLVLGGISLDEICVVTFTNKAALELRSRVRAKLEEILHLNEDRVRDGEPVRVIGPAEREALDTALMGFDRATIDTIHGFCQQVLKDSAFESGRLFQQESIASEEAFWSAFRALSRTRFAQHPDRPLFELALARFGGFEELGGFLRKALRELPYLSLPNIPALEAALSDFPVALAQALLGELENGEGPILQGFRAGGLTRASHGKFGRIVRSVLEAHGACSGSGDMRGFWLRVSDEFAGYSQLSKPGFTGEAAILAAHLLGLQSLRSGPEAVVAGVFLEPIASEMARWKCEKGLFDFDDMIQLVRKALVAPEGEPLVQRLRDRFRVALIDEFQDTDADQWKIFRTIFLEAGDDRHRLILVGDPKQAIYGFRGGDLPTYLAAVDELQRMATQPMQELDTNHRSTGAVIERYNAILDQGFFTAENAKHYTTPVKCGKAALRLESEDGCPLPALRVLEVKGEGADQIRREAAKAITVAIRDLLSRGPRLVSGDDAKPFGPEGVFVLTRTNGEGLEMARVLREHGIPSAFYKQEGIFKGPEAGAILDFLLAVEMPWDESRRAKALLGPFFGLSFHEVEASRELPEHHPVMRRLAAWRELAQARRFAEFFSRIVSESGITRRQLFLHEDQRGLTNVLHILELLQGEATGRHCTLPDLVRTLRAWVRDEDRPAVEDADIQRLERTSGAVQIMTMHKSKGLEAPVVAIFGAWSSGSNSEKLHRYHVPGVGRRVWLGSTSAATEEVKGLIEEEKAQEGERLVYVALTRAKGQLILPRLVPGKAKGSYENLNGRLHALGGGEAVPSLALDFTPWNPAQQEPAADDLGARLATWTPPTLPPVPQPAFDHLACLGRPIWVFSYTSLVKGLNTHQDEERLDERPEYLPIWSPEDGPRGGAQLGTAVHALFEEMPLRSFHGRSFEEWKALPEVSSLLDRYYSGDGRSDVAEWVYRGLSQPLPLPGGGEAIVAETHPRLLRELDFLTPYPGGKDLLTGAIDALFELDGRTYILDWKTNRLEGYSPEQLAKVVKADYELQVQAYTYTTCRFLGIRDREAYEKRFGGVIYVFLRGLSKGEGVWTHRSSWDEVVAAETRFGALAVETLIPVNAGGQKHV